MSRFEAEDEKNHVYKFLFYSVFFTPVAASIVVSGLAFFLALPFAFYFLAIYVLPFAFAGLAIGYYIIKRQNSTQVERFRYSVVGYLIGYALGLGIVFWYPLATLLSSLYSPIIVAAFVGVAAAFYFSKVGTTRPDNYSSQATSRSVESLISARANNFRRNCILLLAASCAVIIFLPINPAYIKASANPINTLQHLPSQLSISLGPPPTLRATAACDLNNPNQFKLTLYPAGFQTPMVSFGEQIDKQQKDDLEWRKQNR